MVMVKVAGPKSIGQAGRLEKQVVFLCYSLQAEFLILWETSVFSLQAFN